MAILVFMIPESPSWLLHKRLYERADEALVWLGMDQEEFVTEVEMDMQHRLEKVENNYLCSFNLIFIGSRFCGSKRKATVRIRGSVWKIYRRYALKYSAKPRYCLCSSSSPCS